MTTRIFVYGTLKRGNRLNGVMRDSTFVSEAIVQSPMFRLYDNGSYPYLVPAGELAADYHIRGEVWDVEFPVLDRLDSIELGAGYDRETIATDFGPAAAYVFHGSVADCKEVPFDDVNGWTEWHSK